jgi:hypothetical protein
VMDLERVSIGTRLASSFGHECLRSEPPSGSHLPWDACATSHVRAAANDCGLATIVIGAAPLRSCHAQAGRAGQQQSGTTQLHAEKAGRKTTPVTRELTRQAWRSTLRFSELQTEAAQSQVLRTQGDLR